MWKTMLLMLFAVFMVTIGDIWMSQAMKGIGEVKIVDLMSIWTTGVRIFTTPKVWMAIGCMASFFFLWISVLSWADLSFVLPVTALTYVLNAAMAPYLLGEHVSPSRWVGVLLITAGVAVVVFSEAQKGNQV